MPNAMPLADYTKLLVRLITGFPDADLERCLHCYGADRGNDDLITHGRPVVELLESMLRPDQIEKIYIEAGYGDLRQFPNKCISLGSFIDALVTVICVS